MESKNLFPEWTATYYATYLATFNATDNAIADMTYITVRDATYCVIENVIRDATYDATEDVLEDFANEIF